ncbi:hypothetical protein BAE44_0013383, partial [Dichanthelium oligosanthes]
LTYQDDECVGFSIRHNDVNFDNEKSSVKNSFNIDASVVEDIRRQREDEGEENYFEDEEDETGWQYASDNEE